MIAVNLMIGWQFDLVVALPVAAVIAALGQASIRRHFSQFEEEESE